ncbi:MAG: hypothetical protein KME27_11960 [Lyngbya sp. HA4199-MV5]|jgi:hypothetical protein|nr:hypothetical protein [Lyngbya sp. HA4199-MV5]
MKPDFDGLSIPELRAYLLSHRHDDEAFYKLVDRLEASSNDTPLYPAPDTPETVAIMETAIREHVQMLEKRQE